MTNRTVLIVADSLLSLHELNDALKDEGYDVIRARSGEEALELLAAHAVDCILLDALMPGRGGQETCARIKAASTVRDIPLIMLTALEDREATIEGLTAGADDFIPKSQLHVLEARVRAQIRRKLVEDENRRIREELLQKELRRRIVCPLLVLWAQARLTERFGDPVAIWRTWGENVDGRALTAGHFLMEESSQEVAAPLVRFLARAFDHRAVFSRCAYAPSDTGS